jgi:hypothetical protein
VSTPRPLSQLNLAQGPHPHRILRRFAQVGLVAIAVLAWIPTFLSLRAPKGDQVWEQFGIWSVCASDNFQLGWAGPGSDQSHGAFTGSVPAIILQWFGCQLAHHSPLNALQSFLALGQVVITEAELLAAHEFSPCLDHTGSSRGWLRFSRVSLIGFNTLTLRLVESLISMACICVLL